MRLPAVDRPRLDPGKKRYFIRLLSTDPEMRELCAYWEGVTRLAVAQMRTYNAGAIMTAMARHALQPVDEGGQEVGRFPRRRSVRGSGAAVTSEVYSGADLLLSGFAAYPPVRAARGRAAEDEERHAIRRLDRLMQISEEPVVQADAAHLVPRSALLRPLARLRVGHCFCLPTSEPVTPPTR